MENYTLDTAARFGEIPFTEFTKELVTGTFDCLLASHLDQMEAYVDFMSSISQDLSTYINNTIDNVSFSEISDFILKYDLPQLSDENLKNVLDALEAGQVTPDEGEPLTAPAIGTDPAVASTDKWWQGLLNTLGPAVANLADKVKDANLAAKLNSVANYSTAVAGVVPNYSNIQASIASLILSNKYGLLQNISKQGMMRLVVTEGEIESKITFSTWNNSESGKESTYSQKDKEKEKNVAKAGLIGLFNKKYKNVQRTVTVNTAKSYQRDSSGSKVDIFGRVLIKFKTDYAPLNG
jgi:hypothetical protein